MSILIPVPAPTPAFEQQLAAAPDAAARLNIAFQYFNIDRGDFKAYAMSSRYGIPYQEAGRPINGIRRLISTNYEPTILDTISNYDKQYALNWKFTPADLLAIEIKLLSHTGILATISYGLSMSNGPGPWRSSPLPNDIKTQIANGNPNEHQISSPLNA